MKKSFLSLLFLALVESTQAQGFINLDFESAVIATTGDPSFHSVYADSALYGWSAYIGGQRQSTVIFNNAPLSDAWVTLQGTTNTPYPSLYPAIQGNYFVMLFGEFNPRQDGFHTNTAAIGQVGQIPLSALTLTFWGLLGGMQVMFAGQPLTFIQTGSAANYNIYSADISAFSGQYGELRFTDLPYANNIGGPGMLDNIQFSSVPIPEPSTLIFSALDSLLIGLMIRGKIKS